MIEPGLVAQEGLLILNGELRLWPEPLESSGLEKLVDRWRNRGAQPLAIRWDILSPEVDDLADPLAQPDRWLVNLFGTDGVRGRVANDDPDDWLDSFVKGGFVGPQLLYSLSLAFCLLAKQAGDEGFVLANDGRDLINNWSLCSAVADGVKTAQVELHDWGIVPTPTVPFVQLRDGISLGAMVTASHNPADQNGIKFFYAGSKLLPQDPQGDWAISALVVARSLELVPMKFSPLAKPYQQSTGRSKARDRVEDYVDLMAHGARQWNLEPGLRALSQPLVVDSANGAAHGSLVEVARELGIEFSVVTSHGPGAHINDHCGVATLEGRNLYRRSEREQLAVVDRLFTLADQSLYPWALALDGDGDRGYVLRFDPILDGVRVLDGDALGYILACHGTPLISDPRAAVVFTVESDLSLAHGLVEATGRPVTITSVGDKWIARYPGSLHVGFESSGHGIVPLEIQGPHGSAQLRSGNGLLSALALISTAEVHNLGLEYLASPYTRGFTKTYYSYHVEKSRFSPGGPVWNSDCRIIESWFHQNAKLLGSNLRLEFQEKEDPSMLYYAVIDGNTPLAAVFCRNSGTESKTAAYVQGPVDWAGQLQTLGLELQKNHHETLKNFADPQVQAEDVLIELLAGATELSSEQLLNQSALEESLWKRTLHALEKEGRVINRGSFLALSSMERKTQ